MQDSTHSPSAQDGAGGNTPEHSAARLAARLTATLESITDAFLMLDRDWNLSYMNGEAERLLQCRREQVIGRNVWQVFPEAVGGPYYRAYHKAVESNSSVSFEEYYAPLNLWTEIRAYPSEEGLAIYFLDISARKASEAEIHQLAFYDRLTGLPNRQLLLNRIEHALTLCGRIGHSGAVLFIDLDNFKAINDTRGHDKGDILLQLVAQRLQSAVRASDTVARFGGDEFVVLLEDLDADAASATAGAQESARKVQHAFCQPFEIAGVQQYSTPSIGITIFDRDAGSVDDVLQRADLAMYQAKAAGRNTIACFDPEMQLRVAASVALEADLRRALAQEEFVLHYQPQVGVDGRLAGAEALLRWNHPQRGLVSPAEFIPVAEDTGLIVPLGQWVLRSACRQLAQWAGGAATAALEMAVNVSAHQFHRPDFVGQVLAVLAETGAPAGRLKLELTESLLLKDVAGTVEKMFLLREVGVGFALDDFGTGYSSLSYLHRLPLDQLKIDRSFIQEISGEGHGAAIVRIIVALGQALDMTVLAEGVETAAQFDFIVAEGCQAYQGYLYSRPLPAERLAEFIAARAGG
ncbi:putative bifunctional diguanylate cyclase/phosphodiesterase [Rugamonas rubra]|uniref:PAS domain S-box-containing protein/diguanylate cyclase (GGDEF) domain-containing protein n=1 Tax=Rugamonas rubra TaxID=758825 RepID=A0A1I4MA21_9BURK|nr:EAL domain-containing protein [Rugamonas rubra]SFM00048.1 PAS domain S-box-containing protein/diguanylate cyclase (GGDEF) domain-containing protein [Rugamonas rubra]